MRWRLHLAKYNFQLMYKKCPRNFYADALSRLATLAEITADDWDELPPILLTNITSAHTETHYKDNHSSPRKLRYKLACKDTHPHRDNTLCNAACLNDMTQEDLFAALPDPTPADPVFEPIPDKEMVTAQFHDAFCVNIRSRSNERVVLPFGNDENGISCRKVTRDKIVIPHTLKQRILHI